MKKLSVVLTLLLVLCCSCCMFACGGGEKQVSEVDLSGQKTNFKEGEDFSVGDLKVTVYYTGDDNAYELKPEDYEVDSSNYNKNLAGQYLITVIPKNQPKDLWDGTATGKDNRVKKTYYAVVDHSWHASTDPSYQQECDCGAKMNSYTGLEDKISTVAWGQQATLTRGPEGKTYPDAKDPIAGETHVSYGSLVKGQSLKLNLQITNLTRTETPGTASAWDTPLMGIRNAGVGMIPREDGWIIATAAGFALPADANIPSGGGTPASGTATTADKEWTVYANGTTWNAGSAFPNASSNPTSWSTVDVEYIYQADGVFMIRHTLHKFDGTTSVYTITTLVPDGAYEVVVYGEFCDFTVTGAEFVASRAIESYEITGEPTNKVQPAGKLFDTTGLNTKATFSDKGTLEGSYNAYAYHDVTPAATDEDQNPAPVKTRVNLATEPLQPDFYDFMVEFNGRQAWLTKDGKETAADADATARANNQKIRVVPTVITGANSSEITVDDVAFSAPDVVYDYAVTDTANFDNSYIRLTMQGAAVKASTEQAAKLENSTHFIAFKLVTNLAADAFTTVTVSGGSNVVVKATKADATVDVVVGLKTGFTAFDLTLKKDDTDVSKIKVDLAALDQELTAYGARVTQNNFTLDAGGTYTVEYTGLGSEAEIKALVLPLLAKRDTVETVMKSAKGTYTEGTPTEENAYRASNSLYITKVEIGTSTLTVTYWLGAPDLGNLTAASSTTAVSLRSGDKVLATANLTYKLAVSSDAHNNNIGTAEAPVYVKANNNKLQVFTFVSTKDVKDGATMAATLNIEHAYTEGEPYTMVYNVGLSVRNGAAAWADENDLTLHASSAAKLIVLGTANNATDYDTGYILVANLHLPALGVREGSSNRHQVYHFTANEDVEAGQEKYTIYTVGDGDDDDNVITTEDVTPSGEPVHIQPGDCVTDDVTAYKKDNFFYGAIIVPATGAHKWGVADEKGVRTCDDCKATNWSVTVDDEHSYSFTALVPARPVVNPDTTGDDWWANPTADVAVSGNFLVRYTWENTDANYGGDGAPEIYRVNEDGSKDYFARRLFVDFNPGEGVSTSALHGKNTAVVAHTKNGETIETSALPAAGGWAGKFDVLLYRYGTTFVLDTAATIGTDVYHETITITEFTTADLFIHINGNHFFCKDIMMSVGSVASAETYGTGYQNREYLSGVPTEGREDGKFYTWADWVELPNLMYGHQITVAGKLKDAGDQSYEAVIWEMKQGITGRMDNWCWSFGDHLFGYTKEGTQNPDEGTNDSSWCTFTMDPEAGENWMNEFNALKKNCDWSINFSWKQAKKVVVTVKLWNSTRTYTDTYNLKIVGNVPAEGLGVHLCAEMCTVSFETLTVE